MSVLPLTGGNQVPSTFVAPKIRKESDVLDPVFRKKVIEEITAAENVRRKREAFKAYECMKDRTLYWVMEMLLLQFDASTVQEMQYSIANVSVMKKIVDKLARVYSNGVKRTLPKKKETDTVEELAQRLELNTTMKKINRYLKAMRNTLAYIKPIKVVDYLPNGETVEKYDLKICGLPPFAYDVIEDPNDPEKPLAIILSDYVPTRETTYTLNAATAGRTGMGPRAMIVRPGDNVDETIADTPFDASNGQFIWWTKNFHFTTNAKGEIISGSSLEEISNPISELPFVNFSADQDGSFWAIGGNDLADGAVRVNTMLTNIVHIAVSQGYGQLYMTGKNLPKSVKVGPNHCIQLEVEDGAPDPKIGYLNSSPPLQELISTLEMYVALLLSTNNLSTMSIASSLKSGKDLASGVALLIDRSESIEDVSDQAQLFRDNEPEIWKRIFKWLDVYKAQNLLVEDLQGIAIPTSYQINLAFPQPQPIVSEQDHLAILQQRKDMGLNSMVELIMKDDPSLTEEEAQAKLDDIAAERKARMGSMIMSDPQAQADMVGETSQADKAVAEGEAGLGPDAQAAAPVKKPVPKKKG